MRTRSGQALDIRSYEGAWTTHTGPLEPFAGYVVFSEQQDVLLIDPDLTALSDAPAKHATTKGEEDYAWSIRIIAAHGQARDTDNRAAVAAGTSPAWDAMDRPEPPVIGDYVSVSFPHPEWNRYAASYSADVRPMPEAGEVWDVAVRTRRSGQVALAFEGVETVPRTP